jgi:hypothetical protein
MCLKGNDQDVFSSIDVKNGPNPFENVHHYKRRKIDSVSTAVPAETGNGGSLTVVSMALATSSSESWGAS